MMKKILCTLIVLPIAILSACSRKPEPSFDRGQTPAAAMVVQGAAPAPMQDMKRKGNEVDSETKVSSKDKKTSRRYLAYEHSIGIDVTDTKIATLVENIKHACDAAENCDVLDSDVNGGEYANAHIKLRAMPSDIPKLIAIVSHEGKLSSQRTNAEDLSGRIEDTAKQIALKEDFRSRLEALRIKAGNDIDALIKVNEQLVQIQSDLESLSGQRVILMKRVDTEILNISIASASNTSVFAPLSQAASGFLRNIFDALATVVTFIALALPWLVFLIFCVWVFKKIRKYRKRKLEKI
ncbi:DUF4349 domain-containing protein [Undibacterium sp. RuTC16W]|uniref:DUF4349 domain-containing protein n=1 Tax=Undibacterium sp. RuTC16W TaxID=3413048 RepID=UPI003BF0ED00